MVKKMTRVQAITATTLEDLGEMIDAQELTRWELINIQHDNNDIMISYTAFFRKKE